MIEEPITDSTYVRGLETPKFPKVNKIYFSKSVRSVLINRLSRILSLLPEIQLIQLLKESFMELNILVTL